ncbi:MAG: acyl-ACP--UDP-N-acetylglucosamine O-acyltransferase [Candidatus Omnitrophica bacterium]|nr:acyl-ACP--UDP-N-acetylglucosamine O-acyltransferase [Candidatus Omnitrophota bacterium]
MPVEIHPTAMVHENALLQDGVCVGPHAIVGPDVSIGAGTSLAAFAQVIGHTEIGRSCQIFSYAVIGSIPQDLKYKGERSYLKIGDYNRIREFVTVNPGTERDAVTRIGNGNLLMAYSHIAHDCVIGNNNILANNATLAGYVTIEDKAVIGGLAAVHQFCRIGAYSIVGGCSKVVQDIPPYSMCDGHPAKVHGLNLVGLRRASMPTATVQALKKAFKILFFEQHSYSQGAKKIRGEGPCVPEVESLLKFVAESKRGINKRHAA